MVESALCGKELASSIALIRMIVIILQDHILHGSCIWVVAFLQ
jgi:hypothetical protein